MHPRHGDEETQVNRLTTAAAVLLFALLLGATVKYDLWRMPEDQSAAILMLDGAALQPMAAAALKPN